jgi:hypothetical protein
VGLVDDHEVPAAAEQTLVGVLDARNPGDRCDDLILLLPRVLAVIGAEHIAADHLEELAELFPSAHAADWTLRKERSVSTDPPFTGIGSGFMPAARRNRTGGLSITRQP